MGHHWVRHWRVMRTRTGGLTWAVLCLVTPSYIILCVSARWSASLALSGDDLAGVLPHVSEYITPRLRRTGGAPIILQECRRVVRSD